MKTRNQQNIKKNTCSTHKYNKATKKQRKTKPKSKIQEQIKRKQLAWTNKNKNSEYKKQNNSITQRNKNNIIFKTKKTTALKIKIIKLKGKKNKHIKESVTKNIKNNNNK